MDLVRFWPRKPEAAATYRFVGIVASGLLPLCASMRQHTIKRPVTLEGVGLHSGKRARVTLFPAPEDTGIVFRAGADRIAAVPGSGGRWIHIFPSTTFRVSYTLDVDHPAIGTQVLSWTPASKRSFADDVAPARTYGFLKDLGIMRKKGLARGGSLDNAVVLANRG